MRLIDADVLMEALYHRFFEQFGDTKWNDGCWIRYEAVQEVIKEQPPTPPTIYGYNIGHLELIARILRKEGLSPESVEEALTDISRIITIIREEYEESLRKAFEHVYDTNI